MRVILKVVSRVCFAVYLMAKPATADFAEDHIRSVGGTMEKTAGGWIIVCFPEKIDDVGEVENESHCRIEKEGFLAVLKITADREQVLPVWQSELCKNPTGKLAVDGKAINKLGHKLRMKKLLQGQTYARNSESAWPYCDWTVESTSLIGFQSAYIKMLNAWRNFLRHRPIINHNTINCWNS